MLSCCPKCTAPNEWTPNTEARFQLLFVTVSALLFSAHQKQEEIKTISVPRSLANTGNWKQQLQVDHMFGINGKPPIPLWHPVYSTDFTLPALRLQMASMSWSSLEEWRARGMKGAATPEGPSPTPPGVCGQHVARAVERLLHAALKHDAAHLSCAWLEGRW